MYGREVGEYSNETLVSLGPTCVFPKSIPPKPLPTPRRRSRPTTLTPSWEQFPNIGAHRGLAETNPQWQGKGHPHQGAWRPLPKTQGRGATFAAPTLLHSRMTKT
jgi:hypothetical protein